MNVDDVRDLFGYNQWANGRLLAAAASRSVRPRRTDSAWSPMKLRAWSGMHLIVAWFAALMLAPALWYLTPRVRLWWLMHSSNSGGATFDYLERGAGLAAAAPLVLALILTAFWLAARRT